MSTNSGSDSGWDDLEHQQVYSYYRLKEEDLQEYEADSKFGNVSDVNTYMVENAKTVEPLGGALEPGQRAELVSLNVGIMDAHVNPGVEASYPPGQVIFEPELSLSPESAIQGINLEHVDTVGSGDAYREKLNPGDNVEVYDLQSHSRDVLYVAESRKYTPFGDTEMGVGGGGSDDDSSNRYFINYRREYGRGPVVDRETNVHEHFFLNSHQLSENLRIGANLSYRLVWDVLDD